MKYLDKIKTNRFLIWLYGQEQDFNNGRQFFGKFTSLSNEFTLAIVVSTYLFGIDLSQNLRSFILVALILMFLVYLFGKLYRVSHLLEIDQRATAMKMPINKIQLEASEIIIARFGSDKDNLLTKEVNIYGDKD